MLMKFGMAINMRMIMMDMTISSSIRVKPRCTRSRVPKSAV